jgi:preprotein translocase subunit SecG
MYQVIIAIHVLLGLGVIGLVMMQQGKGADAGASFGTGSAGSVFGAQGAASFLSRTTAILASLFFVTSLGLAVINGHKGAAYDIMNGPAVGDTPSVPGAVTAPVIPSTPPVLSAPAVDATSNLDEVVKPPSMSQTAAGEKAAVPVVEVPKDTVQNAPAIEKIEVPKAEPIKAVEEKSEHKKHADKKEHKKHDKHETASSKDSPKAGH